MIGYPGWIDGECIASNGESLGPDQLDCHTHVDLSPASIRGRNGPANPQPGGHAGPITKRETVSSREGSKPSDGDGIFAVQRYNLQ